MLIGLIIIPFNQVAFLYGQSLTHASHSSLLFATVPIYIYILATIFLNEKATLRKTNTAIATSKITIPIFFNMLRKFFIFQMISCEDTAIILF